MVLMLTWLRRLLGEPKAPAPKLVELLERLEDHEARLDYLYEAHRKLRGRVTGAVRHQDAPGTTNDTPDESIPEAPRMSRLRKLRGF